MKIMDENQEQAELNHKDRALTSKVTLKFYDSQLETSYNEMIVSELSSQLGINRRERLVSLCITYYSISIVYLASYIFFYCKGDSNQTSLLFQLLATFSSCLVSSLAFLCSHIYTIRIKVKVWLLIAAYFTDCLTLIFNNTSAQLLFFPGENLERIDTILGILPFIYASKLSVFHNFFDYFCFNLFISCFYLLLSILSNCTLNFCVFESLFMVAVTIMETISFYYLEKASRTRYLSLKNTFAQNSTSRDYPIKTDIEEISQNLKESLDIVMNGINNKIRSDMLNKIFENLNKSLNLLNDTNSLYGFDIDKYNQDIDSEDRIFLQETCTRPEKSVRRSTTKFFMRKTKDFLKDCKAEELKILLKKIGKEWNFDTFFVKDYTENKTLVVVGEYCFKRYDLDTMFKIPYNVYNHFLTLLEGFYKPNPYHNSAHAADVLCSYLFIVQQSLIFEWIQDFEILASVIATLSHDVGHPGVTNRFLVNSKDQLALICNINVDNDISVLEMMHCSTVFKIMQNPDACILQNLPKDELSAVRTMIIELILSTDIVKHFNIIGKFKSKITSNTILALPTPEQRVEIMKIVMKASDVGHAAKTHDLHVEWSKLIIDEFFTQGDLEKQREMPVSMFCDRETTDLSKSQSSFIKNIVQPIFESLNSYLVSSKIKESCLDQLITNTLYWESTYPKKRGMTQKIKVHPIKKIRKKMGQTVKVK